MSKPSTHTHTLTHMHTHHHHHPSTTSTTPTSTRQKATTGLCFPTSNQLEYVKEQEDKHAGGATCPQTAEVVAYLS